MIVFLNKQDILEQKIKNGAKIENYFNEYKSFVTNKSNVQELNEYHKARSFVQFKIEVCILIPIKILSTNYYQEALDRNWK